MDGPSYAPAPCFRGAQGTGTASPFRLASGTGRFWLLFAAEQKVTRAKRGSFNHLILNLEHMQEK